MKEKHTNQATPLNQLLNQQNAQFQTLMRKATQHQTIDQLVSKHLSENCKTHCRVAHYDEARGQLILYAKSGAWLTRLRYELSSLKQQLMAYPEFIGLINISAKVAHPNQPTLPSQKKRSARPISSVNAQGLKEAADSTNHIGLKEALNKLAQNTQ